MIVTHLVLPEGLAERLAHSQGRCVLQGAYIEQENLFVAIQGAVESGEQKEEVRAPASRRVLHHWAFSEPHENVAELPCVRVKDGFQNAHSRGQIETPEDLLQWAENESPAIVGDSRIWSVCLLERRSDGIFPHLVICMEGAKPYRRDVEVVPAEPQLPTRMDGLLPLQALRSQRVAVIGVGSGGSATALALAAAGVGTLHLFDHDHLSVDNVFRHACDIGHVGRSKVLAMRDLIAAHQLPTNVVAHKVNVVSDAKFLWEAMDEIDLVVCATDNQPSRRLLNYVCLRTRTPLLMGCAFHNARIGEIIRVLPGQTACYECTRRYLNEIGALAPLTSDEITAPDVPYNTQAQTPHSNGQNNTGTRVDIALIANLLARTAITTLLNDLPHPIEQDLPTNYLTWGVSAGTEFPDPFAFSLPLSVNWMKIEKQANCFACGRLTEDYETEIEAEFAQIMAALSPADQAQPTD